MIHTGNCLEWLAGFEAKSVDHVITDPPFEAEAHTKGRRCRGKVLPNGRRALVPAGINFDPIKAETRALVAFHIARIVRRWALVFCQSEGAHLWRSALEMHGLVYKRTGVWTKPDAQPQLTGDRAARANERLQAEIEGSTIRAREAGQLALMGER